MDNEHSIFDKTDLVFIDPIGTGYSRMVAGEKVKSFTITSAIWKAWASSSGSTPARNQRWPAKYIAGESYGTTRAALAGLLQEKHAMYMNGLMLISCALDFPDAAL